MRKIIINAGHHDNDSGFITKSGIREADETKKIRDALKPLLLGYNVLYVPDELNLKDSIVWINKRTTKEDFAIDIHLNSNSNTLVRGSEAYFYITPRYASVFSRRISWALDVPNRGAKPDTQTFVGSLGFLRLLNCSSVVVECCYLTNDEDCAKYTPQKAAGGIKNAIIELFGEPKRESNLLIEIIRKAIELAKNALFLMQKKK